MDMDKLKKELWVKFAAAALTGVIIRGTVYSRDCSELAANTADIMIDEYEERFGEV
jgi:hypothetical protein